MASSPPIFSPQGQSPPVVVLVLPAQKGWEKESKTVKDYFSASSSIVR